MDRLAFSDSWVVPLGSRQPSACQPVAAVNFHVWQPCNMHCKFCFARFNDVREEVLPAGHLDRADALLLVRSVAAAGFEKINFAGGEPLLCPWLVELIAEANSAGLVTSVVTNGSLVNAEFVTSVTGILDWLTVSVDSVRESVQVALGRFGPRRSVVDEASLISICSAVKGVEIGLRVNTVVTRANLDDDLRGFISVARPVRWKVMQMLPIRGQNDRHSASLAVTEEQFAGFVSRHSELRLLGIEIVAEYNEDMTSSYVMIDPAGRFFDNFDGVHSYSDFILQAGVDDALRQVRVSRERYLRRGGDSYWRL